MNKFRLLGIVMLIVLLALVGSVYAQDATDEPTPVVEATLVATVVVEQPPVVVVPSPSEDHLTWKEALLYGFVGIVVSIAVIGLCIILYRAVTTLGNSYPPGTSTSLARGWQSADTFSKASSNPIDDLLYYLADPIVQSAISAVKERERAAQPPDGTAVG